MRLSQLLILAVPCLFTTTVQPSEPVPHNQNLTVAGDTWTLAIPAGMQLELLTDGWKNPG